MTRGRNSRSRRSILTKVVPSSTILNMMKLTSYRFVTSRAGHVFTLERGLGRKRGVGVLGVFKSVLSDNLETNLSGEECS